MLKFRVDVFAWIPQPEVPNPIHSFPGGVARWGRGACGPYFGGDNFILPPRTPSGWGPRTFRAKQSFEFQDVSFGNAPITTLDTGAMPGTTTVLTATRAAGGTVCYKLTATIKASSASVKWVPSDGWYEVKLHGAAQDPVPAAVGGLTLGGIGSAAASAATPNLEWDLSLRFQLGTTLPLTTRGRYAFSSALCMDVAARAFPGSASCGGTANLVHGLITVRRFPSYIVYLTIDPGSGISTAVPLYFADASGRNLLEIAVGQTDPLRQVTW
jgi:hypothetical protein